MPQNNSDWRSTEKYAIKLAQAAAFRVGRFMQDHFREAVGRDRGVAMGGEHGAFRP